MSIPIKVTEKDKERAKRVRERAWPPDPTVNVFQHLRAGSHKAQEKS